MVEDDVSVGVRSSSPVRLRDDSLGCSIDRGLDMGVRAVDSGGSSGISDMMRSGSSDNSPQNGSGSSDNNWSGGSDDSFHNGSDQLLLANDGVEAIDGIGGVIYNAARTIGLDQRILSLDHISIAGLMLALVIPGQRVLYSVREAVLRVRVLLVGDGQEASGGNSDHGEERNKLYCRR